jgi:hypothetical protein
LNHIQNQENLTDYSVRFGLIQGTSAVNDFYSDDFFNFTGKNVEKNKCDHTFRFSEASKLSGQPKPAFSFNNEKERENFLNYCKTKFVRFLMSLTKHGANITRGELSTIPWLDFTQEWNDKKLCKEFRISEELWEYIDNFIPDYYDDYYSGFGCKNIIPAYRSTIPSQEMYDFVGEEVIGKLMAKPLGNKCRNRNIKFKKDGHSFDMNRFDNGDGTFTWSVYRLD